MGGSDVARAVLRSCVETVRLLARRRLAMARLPADLRVTFPGGRTSTVFRETVVRGRVPDDPAVLVVVFRLRWIGTTGWMHAVFRRTCLVNTPLFAGFPGFVSKLWLTDLDTGVYSGLYEWDGPDAADRYARRLSRVLGLVCVRGSVAYRVTPGLTRDRVLDDPRLIPRV